MLKLIVRFHCGHWLLCNSHYIYNYIFFLNILFRNGRKKLSVASLDVGHGVCLAGVPPGRVLQTKPSRSVQCERCHTPSEILVDTQVSAFSKLGSGALKCQLV